ncbi:MAG: polymerase protein [Candidatus Nomurabacteria bacterium GW2011_GWB1_40_7]|uniref:DNA-directed DNA polymerase n=1 Tax=Candidatus Nomurabacteria bacterium GW2011_GWB1_40_7 TaxID=1618744 RepID=A0A0G0VEN4_9BACT|nr:MAG: polymerase protein [Candidatus Nomurabacteria bacterium GW2011_GWB1_40_7]
MSKNDKTLVLLDAHAIIHRAYHALPEFLSSGGEPTGALYGLSSMLMKIITELKPDYIIACYDLPQKTFRHEAYEKYKSGRAKADEALVLQLKNSRRIFEGFDIPIYDAPGFEADDILGTIVEKYKKNENVKIVIASGDMDTMQLVDDKKVQVYTLKKGINDTILYDEKAVMERFHFKPELLPDYKGLRGDPSDNIIGIKGIGEKTAETLISNFGTIEEIYKKIKKDEKSFIKAGVSPRIIELLKNNEEEALFSKTLATIRADAPINFILPQKTFWENVNPQKIEEVFTLFEFRSLFARLKNFLNNGGQEKFEKENFRAGLAGVGDPENRGPEKTLLSQISPVKLQEASIALWLINSDIPNPQMEDILLFAKTKSFEIAHEYIFEKLKEQKLDKVYEEIERPIIPIVKKMEDYGILIDKKYFEKLSKEYHAELDILTKKIYKMAGAEFNINSPKQLSEVLFDKMGMKTTKKKNASGSFSTKVSVLEELEEDYPIIKEILAYRELQKLLSTYIDVIPKMVAEDGRLHAKFLQNGTTTGRFSSQDPNLQNLPIKTELGRKIRGGFIAPKGRKLAAFDYSQIELRVAAMLSGDKKMTQIFKDKKDIHAGVASFVFGVPLEKVDSEMRRKAKVINFGIIYGMGVSALRKNLGGTREEAQRFYDNYFNQFSGVRDYLEKVKEYAKNNFYTETLFGRRRYFPNINSKIPFLRNMAERTAANASLQGTAADIIKLAIRYAEEDLKSARLLDKTRLVLQVHDELVYEIDEGILSGAARIIEKAMESVIERSYLHYKTDIPLEVHSGSGNNLMEVK